MVSPIPWYPSVDEQSSINQRITNAANAMWKWMRKKPVQEEDDQQPIA